GRTGHRTAGATACSKTLTATRSPWVCRSCETWPRDARGRPRRGQHADRRSRDAPGGPLTGDRRPGAGRAVRPRAPGRRLGPAAPATVLVLWHRTPRGRDRAHREAARQRWRVDRGTPPWGSTRPPRPARHVVRGAA